MGIKRRSLKLTAVKRQHSHYGACYTPTRSVPVTAGRPPRVLVDATSVPADRGGVGATSTGCSARSAVHRTSTSRSCASAPTPSVRGCCPTRRGDRRARRGRPPPGPAGLGADRPAAARPAGRRQGAALAVLHLPAAGRLPGHGHRARRDLLHRAGALRQVPPHVLPLARSRPRCAAPTGSSCRARRPATS